MTHQEYQDRLHNVKTGLMMQAQADYLPTSYEKVDAQAMEIMKSIKAAEDVAADKKTGYHR